MKNHRPHTRSHAIYTIAVIGFIYTLHLVIPMYSNSSFLKLFADERTMEFIYMAGAALSIFGYLVAPAFIRRTGNYATTMALIVLQIALFWGLVTATDTSVLAFIFIVQTAVIAIIGLCLDIFLEVYTDAIHVGKIRGMYTATLNASWVIAPLIGTMLINGTNNYRNTYIASLALLFPLLYLVYENFPRFKDPTYSHPSLWHLIKHVAGNRNWTYLFTANTVLQIFYAWMTVYSPIYLNRVVGMRWEDIGIVLVVMLIPFPLIQYPLGKISDGRFGEKKIMLYGFALMGVSTIVLAFIGVGSVAIWAIALFMTRVGAAAAEVMLETYFFRTVTDTDTAALGAFRMTRPVSYFVAPLLTMIALYITGGSEVHPYLFVVVGVICLLALYPIAKIRDAKVVV